MKRELSVKRRDFIKGMGAVAAGGMVASSLSPALAAETASDSFEVLGANTSGVVSRRNDAVIEYEGIYDVLVIGAGGAGLCAAVEAATAGASVGVIEANPTIYTSNTSLCAGILVASCTQQQRDNGIEDSPEQFRSYLEMVSGGYMSEVAIDEWVKDGSGTIDWLMDLGVAFPSDLLYHSGPETYEPYCSQLEPVKRGHYADYSKSGSTITEVLYNHAVSLGVEFIFENRATELITDPDGRAVGVVTEKGNFRGNKGVVICTAGFTRNQEFKDAFIPDIHGTGAYINSSWGDGLKMCMSVGAKLRTMWLPQCYGFGTEFENDTFPSTRLFNQNQPCIVVDTDGKRPFAEDEYMEITAKRFTSLGADYMWVIWDQKTTDLGPEELFVPACSENCDDEVEKGIVFRADDIASLAEQIGVDADTLVATVEHYNEMASNGVDEDFGRTINLSPIETSPFYACKTTLIASDTAGGPEITANAEVVNIFGEVIPGLYAAGSVTGGWRGEMYAGSGGAVATACLFGRHAGVAAAAQSGSAYEGVLSATAGSWKEEA